MNGNVFVILILTLVLYGCSSVGWITYSDGQSYLRVQQPSNPVEEARVVLTRDKEGRMSSVTVGTGAAQKMTAQTIAASRVWIMYIVAGVVGVAGLVLTYIGFKTQLFPTSFGIAAVFFSGFLIIVTQASVSIPAWVYVVVIAGLLGIGIFGLWKNWWFKRKEEEKRKELETKPSPQGSDTK
jgi:hypothetical protein